VEQSTGPLRVQVQLRSIDGIRGVAPALATSGSPDADRIVNAS